MGLGVEIEIVGRSIQLRLVPEINSRREDLQGNLAFTVLPRGMIGAYIRLTPVILLVLWVEQGLILPV